MQKIEPAVSRYQSHSFCWGVNNFQSHNLKRRGSEKTASGGLTEFLSQIFAWGAYCAFCQKNLFKIRFDDLFKVSCTHLLQNVIREKIELSLVHDNNNKEFYWACLFHKHVSAFFEDLEFNPIFLPRNWKKYVLILKWF